MGLELNIVGEIHPRGLLRRRPSRAQLWQEIGEIIAIRTGDVVLEKLVQSFQHQHKLGAILHPTAGPLEFTWEPAGTLSASVKTSTTGPGFHALCVELLDAVGERCGVRWDWAGDETEFAKERDFRQLQVRMAEFLKTMAAVLLEERGEPMGPLLLNWGLGGARPSEISFSATPNGEWTRAWWEQVRQAQGADLLKLAAEFYPWWGEGFSAEFYRNLGLTLLWSWVRWHPPLDDTEQETCQTALEAFDQARSLDADLAVPEAEMAELQEMMESAEQEVSPPRAEGIGFFRRPMIFPTAGAWMAVIPGYFYDTTEDNGREIVFWHRDRTVRVRTLVWSGDSDPPGLPTEEAENNPKAEIIEHQAGHVVGNATIGRVTGEDREFWQLEGKLVTGRNMCFITVFWIDPRDRQWAIDTFRGVMHPPEEDEMEEV